jgi:hypothetical protein
MILASLGPSSLAVLPGTVATPGSSEWMASQIMATLLQTIKRDFRSRIVFFDLPPLLPSRARLPHQPSTWAMMDSWPLQFRLSCSLEASV